MVKYINADTAMFFLKENAWMYDLSEVDEILDLLPAADVEEVRHGEWEFNMLDNYKKYSVTCPFCGAEYTDNYDGYINVDDFNYCPNCGARMDGDPHES